MLGSKHFDDVNKKIKNYEKYAYILMYIYLCVCL